MLVGREKERDILLSALDSDESQLIAVYGRRRVGKTFLVRHTYKDKYAFQHTGMANGGLTDMLFGNKLDYQQGNQKPRRIAQSRKPSDFATTFYSERMP